MKPASIVAISALATASALYTGFWFYQSSQMEKQTLALVQKAKDDAAVQNLALEYKEISKGGFPLQHKIKIVEPKLVSQNPQDELRWISAGGVTMLSSVFSHDSGTFSIDGDINFAVVKKAEPAAADEGEKPAAAEAAKEEIYRVQFASAPALTIKVNQAQEMQEISYSDTGFTALDGSGAKIAVWEGTKFSLATKDEGSERLTYNVALSTNGDLADAIGNAESPDAKKAKFGKTSFGFDTSFSAPANSEKWVSSDLKLDIRKFEMTSELFNVSVKGAVEKQATAMLPVANLNVAIKPASAFADFVAANGGAIGEMAGSDAPANEKLKTIMEKLADSQNLEGDAFATTLVADNGGNIKIGKLTMEQAIAAISGAPIIPMAPAAGNVDAGAAPDAAQQPAIVPPAPPQE